MNKNETVFNNDIKNCIDRNNYLQILIKTFYIFRKHSKRNKNSEREARTSDADIADDNMNNMDMQDNEIVQ